MSQDAIEIKLILFFLVMSNTGIFLGVKYKEKSMSMRG